MTTLNTDSDHTCAQAANSSPSHPNKKYNKKPDHGGDNKNRPNLKRRTDQPPDNQPSFKKPSLPAPAAPAAPAKETPAATNTSKPEFKAPVAPPPGFNENKKKVVKPPPGYEDSTSGTATWVVFEFGANSIFDPLISCLDDYMAGKKISFP